MWSAVGINSLQLKPVSIAIIGLLGSAVDAAISILAKHGGSLWVADPAYTFTSSDGTGTPNEGSTVGYVRDLVSSRPLLQTSVNLRPKLQRVPKRLGQEMVVNGNFSTSSDWVGVGGAIAISGGQLTLTSSGAGYAARAESPNPMTLKVGATYVLAVNTPSGGAFRLGSTQGQPQLYSSTTLPVGFTAVTWVATAPQAYVSATGSFTSGVQNTFTQISVREVIEWGWALVGDGTDDTLYTAAQPTTNTAETMGVAYWHIGTNRKGNSIHYLNRRNSTSNLGMAIYQGANSAAMSVIAGYGTNSVTASVTPTTSTGAVVSLQADATVMRQFLNGVQVGADITNPYNFMTNTPIYLLSAQGAAFSNTDRSIFAAYWVPKLLSVQERLVVEQAIGQLAGLTL